MIRLAMMIGVGWLAYRMGRMHGRNESLSPLSTDNLPRQDVGTSDELAGSSTAMHGGMSAGTQDLGSSLGARGTDAEVMSVPPSTH